MSSTYQNVRQRGFLKLIFIIIIAIILIQYFAFDVKGFLDEHPKVRAALDRTWDIMKAAWHTFIKPMFGFIWDEATKVEPDTSTTTNESIDTDSQNDTASPSTATTTVQNDDKSDVTKAAGLLQHAGAVTSPLSELLPILKSL